MDEQSLPKLEHGSWDRLKGALERDWEQTKADLLGEEVGHDLHQDIGHTLKQAAGTEGIPSIDLPTCDTDEIEEQSAAELFIAFDPMVEIVCALDVTEIEESPGAPVEANANRIAQPLPAKPKKAPLRR